MSIESAIFFTRLDALLARQEECDRLYFGHEFCQRLLPTETELRRALDAAAAAGLGFTVVTPFVTNAGLARVRELVGILAADTSVTAPEVVVNDWGVLHWLRREHPQLAPVLGRLLTKQKRGPRILRIMERLPAPAREHFQRSNVDTPQITRLLEQMSVQRVELDNLLHGITRDRGLPASLHYPYGYISTTRLCLLMHGDRPGKNLRSLGPCARECLNYNVTLRHPDMPVPLHLKGNTHFFFNDKLPPDLAALNITRLVRTPGLA